LNPSKWSCVECATTDNIWACLTCGYISCGRDLKAHAQKHYQQTKHPIVLEINAKHAYCYKCNNWVTNDNKYDQLQKLRDLLEQAQTNNWGKGEFGEKNTQTNSEIIKYQPNEAE